MSNVGREMCMGCINADRQNCVDGAVIDVFCRLHNMNFTPDSKCDGFVLAKREKPEVKMKGYYNVVLISKAEAKETNLEITLSQAADVLYRYRETHKVDFIYAEMPEETWVRKFK